METIRKMKVCHLASGDLWAGAEVQLADLLCALAERPDLELMAILYNSGILADRLRALDIPVFVLDESHNSSLTLLQKTRAILKREKTDILHTHRYKENILGGLATRTIGKCRMVATVHGMPEPHTGFRNAKTRIIYSTNKWVLRRWFARTIAVSKDIERRLSSGAGLKNIVTIHNGIDVNRAPADNSVSAIRAQLGVGDDEFLIGSVGRLTPVKAYEYLIMAAKNLQDKGLKIKLALIGEGSEKQKLQALSDSLGLGDSVVFPGFFLNIVDFIAAFDIFVLSSLHEGISIALLEALAIGVPVVVTSVGGNVEVVRHRENGILVEPRNECALADACATLLDDRELRKALGKHGRDTVRREFSRETMADHVCQLYKDLMNSV